MEAIYNRLGHWDDATYDALWRRWLWESDPNARPLDACHDMNEMHALGILACLGEHTRAPPLLLREPWNAETLGGPAILHLHPATPVAELTVRELFDQLECLQLHWGPALGEWGPALARCALRALMARLGDIAHHAFPVDDDGVLGDPQHATPVNAQLSVIARTSLRKGVCLFFALLRVCDLVEHAQDVPADVPQRAVDRVHSALRPHHAEASIDAFNTLQQMMYLAPGQRLTYRTQFAGMYNDVSQVVYFHHARYQRKPQIELSKIPDSPMHMLPLITQLLPELPLVYDDDDGAPLPRNGAAWAWLVCCGAIFLVERRPEAAYRLWRSHQLGLLVAHYLQATGKSILGVAEEEEALPEEPQAPATASSHILLLPA